MNNELHCDLGVGEVVALPEEETYRRWNNTTPEWPIMNAVLKGVSRDQLMHFKADLIQCFYPREIFTYVFYNQHLCII